MSNTTLIWYNVKFAFFPRRTTNTALHIFSWQGIKQNFQPPPSSDIFISIRAVQTDRRGKMRLELGWWISSSLPDLKQDIFSIQLFWSSNLHLISPPHKVEIQGRTKKPKSPELYFDRSMNPTEQQGLVFYHRICWHWHLIFILFSLFLYCSGMLMGYLRGERGNVNIGPVGSEEPFLKGAEWKYNRFGLLEMSYFWQ